MSGIEPPPTPWKGVILPLNYTRDKSIIIYFMSQEEKKDKTLGISNETWKKIAIVFGVAVIGLALLA